MAGFDFGDVTALKLLDAWSLGGTVTTVTGRFGGQAIRTNPGTYTIPTAGATMIMGVACNFVANNFAFIDFETAAAANVSQLFITSSNFLQVRNAAGTAVVTGATAIGAGWHYIEFKIFVNGASGTCEVHLDGITEIASTTGNFGSTNIGLARLLSPSNNVSQDDFYVLDTSGSVNNTFLGDVRIDYVAPDGAGAHTQWTPSGGGNNYQKVNEGPPPDGDTSYVSDSTPGDIDTYTFTNVDGGANVHGVQLHLYARKDDAATRQIAPVARQSSTDYVGTTKTLTTNYDYASQLYDLDPSGSAWTATTVNGDEFGVKEIA